MAIEVVVINDEYPNRHVLIQRLTEDGLGVNFNANGDYSTVNKTFSAAPPEHETWYISRIMIYVQDTGNFDAVLYGNDVTMVNGYHSWHTHKGHDHILVPAEIGIKSTGDLAANMFGIQHESFGTGDEWLAAPFIFENIGGPVVLNGDEGETFNVKFRDNLSGLNKHYFTLQGYKDHPAH